MDTLSLLQGNSQSATPITKYNSRKLPEPRLLSYNEDLREIRWRKSEGPWKTLSLQRVAAVLPLAKDKLNNGFTVRTDTKAIIFRADSTASRDFWVTQLNKELDRAAVESTPYPCDENEGLASPEMRRKRTMPSVVLNEFNKAEPMLCSRELFTKGRQSEEVVVQQLMAQLNSYLETRAGQQLVTAPEDLPAALEAFLSQEQDVISDLENRLSIEDTKPQVNLNMLRKRLRVMEQERGESESQQETLEELRKLLNREKDETEKMMQRVEELRNEKSHLNRNIRLYKTELEFVTERNVQLQRQLMEMQQPEKFIGRFLTLHKGVTATFGYDENQMQDAYVTFSHDLRLLTVRIPGMSCDKLLEVDLSTVKKCEQHGTEVKLTLHNPTRIAIIKCAEEASKSLKQLWLDLKNKSDADPEQILIAQYSSTCQQLETQVRFIERLARKYKKTLTQSIFSLDNGYTAQQSALLAEIESLKEFDEKAVSESLSEEALEYLRHERPSLLQRLASLNDVVAQSLQTLQKKKREEALLAKFSG